MSLKRIKTNYINHSEKFIVKTIDFQKQFSHLYSHRLNEMTKLLKERAEKHWGSQYTIKKLCELHEDTEDSCIVIGTLYKNQAHKPSILREKSEENQLAPQPPRQHYADPDDKLILEDELQRVRLCGKINIQKLATGIVCAVLGDFIENGHFEVQEILFYESGPQRSISIQDTNQCIVLISGLDLKQSHNHVESINLFQHWLGGHFNKEKTKELVRLIIAGNTVQCNASTVTNTLQMRQNAISDSNEIVTAMRTLDELCAAWSKTIPIDLMPGAYDPANFMLPQQPFNKFMLPKSSGYTEFHAVSNPHAFTINDTDIVGCAGQNIDDLLRCTALNEPMEALRSTLQWSHLAPTAPDTLACYPYIDNDPFIIHECPHIYFAGNCANFETQLHVGDAGKQTRLVCIPKFSLTHSVVVVNLKTLDCHQVSFDVKNQ